MDFAYDSSSSSKVKAIVFALLAILLSLSLMAAGTYALFTGKTTVGNHLKAGTLDCTLERTKLVKHELDSNGVLVEGDPDTTVVDFTTNPDANLFGFNEDTVIVPRAQYAADLRINNNGDVAFGYFIEIVIREGTSSTLVDQLAVSIGGKSVELSSEPGSLFIGSEIDFVGRVPVGQSTDFTVTVEFLDLENNNDAKGDNAYFDLVVHAIQLVA